MKTDNEKVGALTNVDVFKLVGHVKKHREGGKARIIYDLWPAETCLHVFKFLIWSVLLIIRVF